MSAPLGKMLHCLAALLMAAGQAHAVAPAGRAVLAVCADPTNLPYSDESGAGFENKIARLIASDLHRDLRYDWNRKYRSFLRNTLLVGTCDVVIGVPTILPGVAVTKPYATSSYVAVTRAADPRQFTSFDDAWLHGARIGVQLLGTDGADTPPAMSLTKRGINQHLTGFSMRADSSVANPQGRIIDAVADGTIDIALVWGPLAGYFAKAHGAALRMEPITGDPKLPDIAFVYPISMGVRPTDTALRDLLQGAIDRHQGDIDTILRSSGVPLLMRPE